MKKMELKRYSYCWLIKYLVESNQMIIPKCVKIIPLVKNKTKNLQLYKYTR